MKIMSDKKLVETLQLERMLGIASVTKIWTSAIKAALLSMDAQLLLKVFLEVELPRRSVIGIAFECALELSDNPKIYYPLINKAESLWHGKEV